MCSVRASWLDVKDFREMCAHEIEGPNAINNISKCQ